MRRGAGTRGMAALAAVLGAALFCASSDAASVTGRTATRTDSVEVPVACPVIRLSNCAVSVQLKAQERRAARARKAGWITVGRANVSTPGNEEAMAAGEVTKVAVALNQTGRQLLRKLHRLTVEYTVAATPEALTGAIVVHVYDEGGPPIGGCTGTICPAEGGKVYVARVGKGEKLGPKGEIVSSIESTQHTIHVPPGEYEVRPAGETEPLQERRVTVSAGQTVEVREAEQIP